MINNKVDYNTAESVDVGIVTTIGKNKDHSTSIKGTPYSVNQKTMKKEILYPKDIPMLTIMHI